MIKSDASMMEQPSNRIRSCWSFGNPYSLRFLDDPPADPPAADPPAVPAAPASPFNADGTFVENWHTMAPDGYEELREDKTLPRLKNPWDMARSYVQVRKQVPLDKMPRPNENFSEQDWGEFHKAGGRPDTAGDYNIKRPDEIPEELMPKEIVEGFQELFHKIGLSKKQSDALTAYNNEKTIEAIQDMAQKEEQEGIAVWDAIHKEWGRAFDQNVHRGNVAIHAGSNGDEGLEQRLLAKANKDPDLLKLVSNLGGKFTENTPFESSSVPTPSDLQTQIAKLRADPRYMSKDKSVRQPIIDQISRLTEQMFKDKA